MAKRSETPQDPRIQFVNWRALMPPGGNNRLLSITGFACISLLPGHLLAQPENNAQATDQVEDVEVLVITTQKREQSTLEVPLSVGVVTGAFLEEQGLYDLDDAAEFIPGFQLQLQQINAPSFVIRGITSDASEPESEPNVSVFFDGIPGSRAAGSVIELFDLERVEVAKGPQGTLFSRGASNGAVNFIFRKPEDDRYAEFALGYGNFDNRRIQLITNAPLIEETLYLRLGAVYHERDGFTDNAAEPDEPLNGKDTLHLRASAKLEASETLDITFLSYFQVDSPDQTSFKTVVPSLALADPLTDYDDPTGSSPVNAFGPAANDPAASLRRRVTGLTTLIDWSLSDYTTISSTTGYRRFQSEDIFDTDGTSLPLVSGAEQDRGELFFQELRFTYDSESWFSTFGGVSFFRETASRDRSLTFNQDQLFDLVLPLLTGSSLPFTLTGLPNVGERAITENTTNSISAFLDATIEILEDTLLLTGGSRITVDQKEFRYRAPPSDPASALVLAFADLGQLGAALEGDNVALAGFLDSIPTNPFSAGNTSLSDGTSGVLDLLGIPTDAVPSNLETNALDGSTGGQTLTTDETFTYIEPRAILEWRPVEGLMTYASYSWGIRSGGLDINPRQGVTEDDYRRVIDEERVTSYEVGLKTAYDLGLVRIAGEAAAYYYDYDDFQTLVVVEGAIRNVNAGEASALGAEGSFSLEFDGGLTLFGNASYIDGQVDEGGASDLFGTVEDLSGNRFRLTPEFSGSGGITLTRDLSERISATVSVLGSYRSRVFFNSENEEATETVPQAFAQDGYPLFWATAGMRLDQRYGLTFRVENLLDEEYLIDVGNTGRLIGVPTSIPGQPRFFMVTLDVRL